MAWIGPWLSPSSSRMGQKAYITQQNSSNGVFPKINARMSVHSFNFFNLKEESCQSLAKGWGFSPSHWRFSCPSAPTPQSLLLGKHYNFLLFRNHAVGVPTQSTHVVWVNGLQRKCWTNSVERDTFFKDVLPVRVQTIKSEYKNRKMSTQNGSKRRKWIWNVFLWLSNYMQWCISSIDSTFLFDQRFFTVLWTFLAVTCHDRGSVSYLVHKILLVRFQFFFVFHSWIYTNTERSKNVTVLLKFTTSSKPYRSTKYLQWLFRPNALLRSWNSATWSNFSTPFICG